MPTIGASSVKALLSFREEARFPRLGRVDMSLLVWILLGLVAGFLASHVVNHHGEGIVLDALLGVVGAIIGGWVFQVIGHTGVKWS